MRDLVVMPQVRVEDIPCPVHRKCIGPWLSTAAYQLAFERLGRCICGNEGCQTSQIMLRAWHLFWQGNHDDGDEDRS